MNEPAPPPLAAPAAPKRRNNGCLIVAVSAIVAGVLLFSIGGYYAMMHSALPLRSFASMINSSKQAKIEGLEGTLATGFKFDEFRVFKTGLGDSYVRDFSFKFNGMPDLSSSARLVIDELHIGRIYLSLPVDKKSGTANKADVEAEFKRNFEGKGGDDLRRFELKSFRIDEVLVQDAAGERMVGSLRLAGLVAENDGTRLDELELVSDFIDARLDATAETNRFRQVIHGLARPSLHTNVLRDLDFAILFGGSTNGGAMRIELFGGALIASGERDGTSEIRFNDFSPREWLGGFSPATPSRMSFTVTGNKSGKRSKVSAGRLTLGRVDYVVPEHELDHTDFGGGRLRAEAKIDGHTVSVEISHPDDADGFRYTFSGEEWEGNELIARALFDKGFDSLNEEERAELRPFQGPEAIATAPPTP